LMFCIFAPHAHLMPLLNIKLTPPKHDINLHITAQFMC